MTKKEKGKHPYQGYKTEWGGYIPISTHKLILKKEKERVIKIIKDYEFAFDFEKEIIIKRIERKR